jgi:phenylacetate-coenzyme A ligase PaaK-like adenylate-forming protein
VEKPENWGRLMAGRWMVSMTSGTTGAALIIPQDILAVDWNHAAHAVRVTPTARASSTPKPSLFRKRPKVVAFTTLSAPSVSSALFMTRPWISRMLWDYRTVNATAPWEEIVRQVEEIQPEILIGYASLIGRLAQAKLEGRLRLDLPADTGVISSGGDTLTPGIRALCRQAFGIEPLDGYGCGGTLGVARQWKGMPHMVIFGDIAVLEAVDAREQACAEGELSDHALVTPLFNTALPLLRYRLEDRILLGPVQEGWPFRTLAELMGRGSMSYLFKVPESRVFIGTKLIATMEHLPEVTLYQFRQTGWDELECRFVVQGENEAALRQAIQIEVRRCLDGAGCAEVKFQVHRVHSLEPDPRTGKVEQNRPFPPA